MEGYIKISRAILHHPALNKRERAYCEVGAWLWLLLEASFAERDFSIGTQTVRLRRGELCHSVSYMAEAWGWSQSKTRHYIDKLVKFNSILLVKPEGKSADFPNIVKIINKDIIYIDEFNEIWGRLRAKRGSKKVALQKYNKIKGKVNKDTIVEKYNQIVKKASSFEFIPHFSTFLSQERWLDEDSIVAEKKITPEQFFRKKYPNTVPDGYVMTFHSWNEITFTNGKEQVSFNYMTGEKI